MTTRISSPIHVKRRPSNNGPHTRRRHTHTGCRFGFNRYPPRQRARTFLLEIPHRGGEYEAELRTVCGTLCDRRTNPTNQTPQGADDTWCVLPGSRHRSLSLGLLPPVRPRQVPAQDFLEPTADHTVVVRTPPQHIWSCDWWSTRGRMSRNGLSHAPPHDPARRPL